MKLRRAWLALGLLLLTGVAGGQELSPRRPANAPKMPTVPQQVLQRMRQGGDTLAEAVVIPALPYADTGTTVGYADDYDALCPFSGTGAPDVVYRYQPSAYTAVTVDLCGSGFDTKVSVLNSAGDVIACNDDHYWDPPCGVYVSRLDNVMIAGGEVTYIVVDGYGDAAGDYQLAVTEYVPCYVAPPAGAQDENEPALHDGYRDNHNFGCFADYGFQHFTELTTVAGTACLYGRSGWFLCDVGGLDRCRDADWYTAEAGSGTPVVAVIESEQPVDMYEMVSFDPCDWPFVRQQVPVDPCEPATMHVAADHGAVFCLLVMPTGYEVPDGMAGHEFDYTLTVTGLDGTGSPTEAVTWGAVKSLYR
jgi:hypothetical protein